MAMSSAMYAAPTAIHLPVHAIFSKQKMVSFNVQNATKEPIKVKVGETQMTLLPGVSTALKLAPGVQILAAEASSHYAAGSVITVVTTSLSDTTVVLN